MKRINIIVHGLVQGVFFSYNIKKEALNLGLKGYAKNLPDGTVEVVAEGPEDKLKELMEYCKKSPGASQVDKIGITIEKPKKEFESFEVRN